MFVKVCLFVALATVAMSAPVDDKAPKKATVALSAPVDDKAPKKPLTLEDHWVNFKTKFNRKYETPEEDTKRFGIFKGNFERIDAHNKKYDAGEVSYKQGINDFADLTQEEFAKTHLMHFPASNQPKTGLVGTH